MKFSWEYFHGTMASSVHYLTIAKYSLENFRSTLKNRENCKSLASESFPVYGNSSSVHWIPGSMQTHQPQKLQLPYYYKGPN